MRTRSFCSSSAVRACGGWPSRWPVWRRCGWRRRPAAPRAPKFYSDDPIWRDPETQDASKAQPLKVSDQYDLIENSFLGAGDRTPTRAVQRQHRRRGAGLELVHQPRRHRATGRSICRRWSRAPTRRTGRRPDAGRSSRARAKASRPASRSGTAPARSTGSSSIPTGYPEMASGAEVISTKFFHAFGYHVPENYLATLRPRILEIAPDATMKDEDGRRRRLTRSDVDDILEKAARAARRHLPRARQPQHRRAAPLGPFRYYGTRPDDPNDIFPHEHRRELRGLSVFAAWLNHDEVRSRNSLDTLVRRGQPADRPPPPARLRIDARQRQRQGAEPPRRQRVRLGGAADAHHDADARALRAAVDQGGLSGYSGGRPDRVDLLPPEEWKPDYPNPAFRNARPDDRFWAARIVAAFPDEAVRRVVRTARVHRSRAPPSTSPRRCWSGKSKVLDGVAERDEPGRQRRAERVGRADVRERGRAGRRRQGGRALHGAVVAVRQRHRHASAGRRRADRHGRRRPGAGGAAGRAAGVRLRAAARVPPRSSRRGRSRSSAYFRRAGDGWTLVGLERNP